MHGTFDGRRVAVAQRVIGDDREAFLSGLCYVGHANALHGELTGIENLDFETCLAGDSRAEARQALADATRLRVVSRG